ncbi:hypothetical protein, partial [Leptospira adleri]
LELLSGALFLLLPSLGGSPFFEFDRYKLNRQGEPSHSFLNLRNILDVIVAAREPSDKAMWL